MFGAPKDVPGQCNAWLRMACDHGDNPVTFRCQLPEGHIGQHEERCRPEGDEYKNPDGRNVVVRWLGDDRIRCTWEAWRMKQYEEAGFPDEWEDGEMPEGWNWAHYRQKLQEEEDE